MHPLMAQAFLLGAVADGMTDPEGWRIRAWDEEGVTAFELVDATGAEVARGFRLGPSTDRPSAWPEELPFLVGMSCAAVLHQDELTVTWPDAEAEAAGGPPLSIGPDLLGGRPPPDPVAEAWRRYSAGSAAGGFRERLSAGFEELLRVSREEGWTVVGVERAGGGRVARFSRNAMRRSITLSAGLGVASLVLMDRPDRGGGR